MVKTSENSDLERFVVNETGVLHFDPQDDTFYIEKMYITGMNVPYTYLNKDRTADRYNEETYSYDIEYIQHPVEGDYCRHDGFYYVFYHGNWYMAEKQDNENVAGQFSFDIKCSVDALVFYYGVLRRDIFWVYQLFYKIDVFLKN